MNGVPCNTPTTFGSTGDDSFNAEYQNSPRVPEAEGVPMLTAEQIMAKVNWCRVACCQS
jgi:hypothetical protein